MGGFGIVGCTVFWAMFLSVKGYGRPFYLFRDLAGAYFALLLCISNSPFTIKTGAVLWFLAGVLSFGERPSFRSDAIHRSA
jgi:putative polymerase